MDGATTDGHAKRHQYDLLLNFTILGQTKNALLMEKQRPSSIVALTYDIILKEHPVLHYPQVLASPSAKNIRHRYRYTSTVLFP